MSTIRITVKKLLLALLAVILMLINTPHVFAKNDGIQINAGVQRMPQKMKIHDQSFEITGKISAVAGNNFVVLDQTIFIDPSQVGKFKQKGILGVGQVVKVKGVIISNVKYAQDINVIGTGGGRFQFTTEDHPTSIGTTVSSNVLVKVKANGPAQTVETFLEQILNLLKSFIS